MDTSKMSGEDILNLTRKEKTKLVTEVYDGLCKELGPEIAPNLTKRKLCEMVQKRLPTRPLYKLASIESIIWGVYK